MENTLLYTDNLNKNNDGFLKAAKILEFERILDMLCECAPFSACEGKIRELVPSVSADRIRQMQKYTSEAKSLITVKGMPSFCSAKDISSALYRAGKGASLNCVELLSVCSVLKASRNLSEYFDGVKDGEKLSLYELSSKLSVNKYLEESISSAIISEDQIADNASGELYDIRRKIRSASSRIRETLNKYISGGENSKYLQENIVTTRNGRYVIPVKAEYRNMIKGLVHDTSASGATLFLEPMSVVEANNEIRMLESREKAEIERILASLSEECRRFSDSLSYNFQLLCELGVIFAKGELSVRLNCIEPAYNGKKQIVLNDARHPLLDKEKVVPISISFGKQYNMIIVTGPNTGGKTVTLKTVGLLSYMAQCGMHIPCSEGSALYVFDSILADIGDEQSIEQSLSTFSAHMVNVVDILSRMTPDSLVLFDELGAGTDPVEGAALAQSILERVRQTSCICCATTHYAELKAYALSTNGVTNASCEFDVDTLRPTYKLTVGLPGRSNAFSIARRLGIPEDVIDIAKSSIEKDSSRFESVIAQLEQKRIELEAEKEKTTALRENLEKMHQKTREQTDKLNERIEKEIENAQRQARNLINSARASADYIFEELDKVKKQKDKENFAQSLSDAKLKVKNTLKNTPVTAEAELVEEEYELPRNLVAGDSVMIRGINKNGTVVDVSGKFATVQAGAIKTKVELSKLILLAQEATVKKNVTLTKTPRSVAVKPELDVRGFIGDDAWFMVDKYLDDALLANLSQVTVIHGKGTGALRSAIQGYLKRDKRVESFRNGAYGEGDSGVTVIKLK